MTIALIILGILVFLLTGVGYITVTLGNKHRKEKWWEIFFYPSVWAVFGLVMLYGKLTEK